MYSDFKELLRIFNDYQVNYLVIGGYAVMQCTEPRYTKDRTSGSEPMRRMRRSFLRRYGYSAHLFLG